MKTNAIQCLIILTLAIFGSFADAEPVCVTAPRANLRTAPSTQASVNWMVGQNMPLLRIEQKGAWSKVKDLEGETHWVSSSVLSPRVACAVVKTKTARLLTGPGAKFAPAELSIAPRYTPFKKIDRDEEWILVQDEYHGQYWIHESNVWIPVTHARITF